MPGAADIKDWLIRVGGRGPRTNRGDETNILASKDRTDSLPSDGFTEGDGKRIAHREGMLVIRGDPENRERAAVDPSDPLDPHRVKEDADGGGAREIV